MLKPAKLTKQEEKLWNTLVFLGRLLILAVPLYLVIWLGLDLSSLQLAVADQSAWMLRSLGWLVEQDGILLTANGFQFLINGDCTGWKSILFLSALILAVPGPLSRGLRSSSKKGFCFSGRVLKTDIKKRLIGIILGIPIIWLGNLIRITGTVYIQAVWGTNVALVAHDWGWQLGLVALVLAVWLAWLKFIARKPLTL